jgi:hypothetical protein
VTVTAVAATAVASESMRGGGSSTVDGTSMVNGEEKVDSGGAGGGIRTSYFSEGEVIDLTSK